MCNLSPRTKCHLSRRIEPGSARQLARFLCGIASPALSTAKLTRHPRFGAAAEAPFAEVMSAVKVALA